MALTILYRGSLSSCNYDCGYCPFAKRAESPEQLARDRAEVERFVGWVRERRDPVAVFFTPWGEALVRGWYRDAIETLSGLPHVSRVAIQTNLHAPLEFLGRADRATVALWCTYHPGQTARRRFVERCETLIGLGVRFSVGVVGLREHVEAIEALRRELPAEVYVWVNAFKREPDHYDAALVNRLCAVDPLFELNARRHPSRGRLCQTGHRAVSVDGAGGVRRCHFVAAPLGNLYDGSFALHERPRPCPNDTCGCYIGYAHLRPLRLEAVYGAGLIERIPSHPPTRATARRHLSVSS